MILADVEFTVPDGEDSTRTVTFSDPLDGMMQVIYAWGQDKALVFTPQLAARLAELDVIHGTDKCRPVPRTLTDGRLMLCADILSEVVPGGMLEATWNAADKATLLPAVEVMPMSAAVKLLPPPPVPGEGE